MSGSYSEVVLGVVASFLAFVLGLAWRRLTKLVVNYRARRFWRPLVERHLTVVLGRLPLPQFEASGVVGAGDNIALRELSDYLHRIGFRHFSLLYHDESGWNSSSTITPLTGNLILLGGPDANSLTREVIGRITLGLEFREVTPAHLRAIQQGRAQIDRPPTPPRRWPGQRRRSPGAPQWRVPVMVDRTSRQVYGPTRDGDDVHSDCGVMIRCPNPFNPDREVMIFCGSYGYGTWAAVRFAVSDEFLRRLPAGARFVECVLSADIVHHAPQRPTVEVLRPLTTGERTGRP